MAIGFWRRLRYAIDHRPIEKPRRWIFNRSARNNPAVLLWAKENNRLWLEGSLPESVRKALASSFGVDNG